MGITAERVKHLRTSRGYTQQQLADMAHTTKSAVCMWESGKNMPSRISLEMLGDIFNVDTDYLLGRENTSVRLLNSEELDLVDAYRSCSPEMQEGICRMLGVKRAEAMESAG